MKQLSFGNQYSYTIYDELGRIIEVGRIEQDTAMTSDISHNPYDLTAWYNTSRRYEITHTYYDEAQFALGAFSQENLRGRVASVTYEDQFDDDSSTYNSASH